MRHLARGLEEALTPGVRLSDCHLNKHRLINSLWTKVSERSEGVCPERCHSALLNPQNFANTIGKPTSVAITGSRRWAAPARIRWRCASNRGKGGTSRASARVLVIAAKTVS